MNKRQIHDFYYWAIIWHHIVSEFLKICTDLHRYDHKIVFVIVWHLKLFRNNSKSNFVIIFVQICANLQKYWNNALSNDGLIIEIIDQYQAQALALPSPGNIQSRNLEIILLHKIDNFQHMEVRKKLISGYLRFWYLRRLELEFTIYILCQQRGGCVGSEKW